MMEDHVKIDPKCFLINFGFVSGGALWLFGAFGGMKIEPGDLVGYSGEIWMCVL